LTPYWFYRGRLAEADHWGRRLLAATVAIEGPERADALALAGRFRLFVDDTASARPLLEEALAIFRAEDDRAALARCMSDLGAVARLEHRFDDAISLLTDAVELHRGLEDTPYEATGALHFLGETLRDAGRLDAGRAYLEEAIVRLRALGADLMVASSTHSLGDLELDAGRPERAAALYREALDEFRGTGMEREIANSVGGLAAADALVGQWERAAKLWGSVEAIEARLELRLFEHERERYLRHVAAALQRHPACLADGRTWTLDQAVTFALGEVSQLA
jgi:tetratricopeptide (TPR) repeat protein